MTPTFNTWDRAVLDKFALEAYLRMQKQQDQLEQLRGDLKDAIEAYRVLNKGSSSLSVDDERLTPGLVSNADVRPGVILADDLVIGQLEQRPHYGVWSDPRHSKVSSQP